MHDEALLFNLTTAMQGRHLYCYFTDKGMEAQRGYNLVIQIIFLEHPPTVSSTVLDPWTIAFINQRQI